MSRLGTLVVRIAAEISSYKADMSAAADTTAQAAQKIEQGASRVEGSGGKMGESMGEAAQVARELYGAVGLAGLGLTAVAAGMAVAAFAAHQGAKEQQEYHKSLTMTSNAAGTTTSQMQAMAASIGKTVGTQGQAADALAQMAATGQVAAGTLIAAGHVAIELQRTMGQSVADTTKVFAELGGDPVKASLKLNESMGYLTASTFAQIKAAQELGDKSTAASTAQNAYAQAQERNMAKIREGLGTLERAWQKVKDAAAWAWDSMMGLGRQTGPEQELERAKKVVANLENQLAKGNFSTAEAGRMQALLADMKAHLAVKQESARLDAKSASSQAEQVASEKAKINWLQDGAKYLTDQKKLEQEIAKIRYEGAAAGISKGEIEARVARAREMAQKGQAGDPFASQRDAAKDWARYYTDFSKGAEKAAAEVDGLSQSQAKLLEYLKSPAYTEMDEPAKQLALQAAYANVAQESLTDEIKRTTKENEAAVKAYESMAAAREKEVESGRDAIAKQKEHNAAIGLSVDAQKALEIANLKAHADALDRKADLEELIWLDGKLADSTRERAQGLRDLAAAKESGNAAEIAARGNAAAGVQSGIDDYLKQIQNTAASAKDVVGGAFKSMEDALVSFIRKGKLDFASLEDIVVSGWVRMKVQKYIMEPMASSTGGMGSLLSALFNANGNAFAASGVQAFANGAAFTNSVVNTPTAFAFAKGGSFGLGVAGEKGAEAVMPLTRGPDGRLGVQATGGGGSGGRAGGAGGPQINLTIYNTVGDVATLSQLRQAQANTERRIAAALGRSMQYGGAMS